MLAQWLAAARTSCGFSSARHDEVVIRESVALGAVTLGLAGVAVLLVRRRGFGMTFSGARLAWRMQRWELAILIGGSLLLAAAAGFVAWQSPLGRSGMWDAAG